MLSALLQDLVGAIQQYTHQFDPVSTSWAAQKQALLTCGTVSCTKVSVTRTLTWTRSFGTSFGMLVKSVFYYVRILDSMGQKAHLKPAALEYCSKGLASFDPTVALDYFLPRNVCKACCHVSNVIISTRVYCQTLWRKCHMRS